MTRWKRLVLKCKPIGFLLVGLLLIELTIRQFSTTWERYSPDDYAIRVQHCAAESRDFVLVGGSPVSEGLDPSLIAGVKWKQQTLNNGYAVGLPGGTTTDVYFATKQSCQSWPKLLIYGVAASDLNDSRNEPHGAASLLSWADWQEAISTRPDAAKWLTKHFLQSRASECFAAWHYRHGIRMFAADQFVKQFPSSCPESFAEAERQRDYADRLLISNGYAPASHFATRCYSDMKKSGWIAPPFSYLAKYKTGSHLRYLHKLHELCCSNSCDLVILEMPATRDLEERHPAEIMEFRRVIRDFCDTFQVNRLVATRTEVELDDGHFADLIHLNATGAERLSRWLKVEVGQIGGQR